MAVSYTHLVMDEKETKNVKVSDLWTEFFHNRPLRIVALFFITAFAMMSVGNASGAYFMNDLEQQTPLAQEGDVYKRQIYRPLLYTEM